MYEVTQQQVVKILQRLGLTPGSTLMVHSALQFLGRPDRGPQIYLAALCEQLNIPIPSLGIDKQIEQSTGTLAVPTFNFGFARGETYDEAQTPSEAMGILSETIRQLPEAKRTKHPLQSMSVIGKYTQDLANRDTLGAFDSGSAFERLLELNARILLLGADIHAVSLIHYSEQRAAVPYRYWKDFTGDVYRSGKAQQCTYRMFARDLVLDPKLNLLAIQQLLEHRNQWKKEKLNYGTVAIFSAHEFVTAADDLLAKDPWIFVANRPFTHSEASL